MTKKKAQLEVGVNAGPAEEGFKKVERAAKGMGDTLKQETGKGQEALKGLGQEVDKQSEKVKEGFGKQSDGAKKASKNVEVETRNMIASVQRATAAYEAGEKGTAKYFEALAKSRGLDMAAIAPHLDAMRAIEAAQNKVGMSARATSAAMRGVPAQFTDIFTSLQGGQAPLTVFLQQGGQLKDMFGGAGNAARALGGYVAGLINPFSVAAVGVGVLGLAYYKGSQEADVFRQALLQTGNAAGASTSQLAGLAQSVSAGYGTTVGAAAEAMAAMAATGQVGRATLADFAATSVAAQKAFGMSAQDIAKNFADLGKEPVSASLKLNEGMNYLTASTFAQIKAAQDLGQESKAAALAQDAYNSAMKGRSAEVLASLGTVEKMWNGVKGAATLAWDAMLGVGRPVTVTSQISLAQKNLEASLEKRKKVSDESAFAPALDKEIVKLKEQVGYLGEIDRMQKRAGDSAAERIDREKAGIQAQQDGLKYLSETAKMQREIAAQSETLRHAGASQLEIDQRIAQIKSSYAQKNLGAENEVAGTRAKIDAATQYLARLNDLSLATPKLTEAEGQVLKVQKELEGAITGAARAIKEKNLIELKSLVTLEQTVQATELWRTTYLGVTKALQDSAIAITKQAAEQEAANAVYGKGTAAIQAMTLAQLKQHLAETESVQSSEYVANLKAKIAAQERYVKALNAADYKTLNAGLDEWLRGSAEAARLFADEAGLAGLAGLQRAKIIAHRQVELQLAKEIRKIDLSTLDDDEKERLVQKARNAAVVAGQAATAKAVQDDWTKTADQISQSLTDALMRGFESGKGFAQNLRDTIQNMFSTLVLRPVVQAAVGGLIGLSGPAMAGGGGAGAPATPAQLAQGMGSASSLAQLGDNLSKATGQIVGLLNGTVISAGASSAWARGADWLGSSAPGLSGWMKANPQIGGYIGTAGNALAGYGISRGLSGGYQVGNKDYVSAIAAVGSAYFGPVAGLVGAAVNRAFGMGPVQTTGSGITGTFNATNGANVNAYSTWSQKGGWFRSDKSGVRGEAVASELDQMLDRAIQSTGSAAREYAKVLGLSTNAVAGFSQQINLSLQGLDEAGRQNAIAKALGDFGDNLAASVMGSAGAALRREGETAGAALARLASSFSGVNDVLKTLGHTLLLPGLANAGKAQGLVDQFGSLDAYAQSAGQYLQAFYSEAERTAMATRNLESAMGALGLGLPQSTAQFRALVEAQNLSTEGGRKTYATLLKLAPAFADVTAAAARAAEQTQAEAKAKEEAQRQAAAQAEAAIFSQRMGLQDRLDQLLGNSAALRERERAALDESNRALFDEIQFYQARQEAASAYQQAQAEAAARRDSFFAEQQGLLDQLDQLLGNSAALRERERAAVQEGNRGLFDQIQRMKDQQAASAAATQAEKDRVAAIQGSTRTIEDEIKRLRGLDGQGGNAALLQTQFAVLTGQARAGDVAALGRLPEITRAIEQASATSATSALDMTRLRARLAASLTETLAAVGQGVPAFAAGGLHAGGIRLVGERGPELEVTGPARYLSASLTASALSGGGNAALIEEIRALREQVRELQANTAATAVTSDKTARTLDRCTQGTDTLMTQQVAA